MADTTEARRLADELTDDADQSQAYIPRLRKSASMLRAIADRCDALEKELQALRIKSDYDDAWNTGRSEDEFKIKLDH